MTNKELVQRAIDTVKNYKTVYANGMFGSPIAEGIISQKTRQLPKWYTASRQAALRGLIGKGYFGFDCSGFIKSVLLWNWHGDYSHVYGGINYVYDAVDADGEEYNSQDINQDGFINVLSLIHI